MPSEPRRATRKTVIFQHRCARSAGLTRSFDAALRTVSQPSANASRLTTSFRFFWRRRRSVTPAALRTFVVAEQQLATNRTANFANENIVFLNNPTEFDLRSYFFKRRPSGHAIDRLERSVISLRSTSSRRSNSPGFTPPGSISLERKPKTIVDSTAEASTVKLTGKPRRRLRSKEELCLVLPRSTTRGRTRSQKSWFLGPGFIGREAGEDILVVTKDKSMDPVHAEISVAGDDYFVRDADSTMGTFLCLSTRYRHHPQRDGFRLCRGDVFRIGPATSIRVLDLQTSAETTSNQTTTTSSSITSFTRSIPEEFVSKMESNRLLTSKPDRILNFNISSSENAQPASQRVERLRFLAADIDEEFMNGACSNHSRAVRRNEHANNDSTSKVKSKANKSVRTEPQCTVRFADTPPMMSDGSVFLGSRYIRPEVKELHYWEPSEVEDAEDDTIKQLVGSDHKPSPSVSSSTKVLTPESIRLTIFQHDLAHASTEPIESQEAREVTLFGQKSYLIGSSAACDVRIFPSEGNEIQAVHARIYFDGVSFVLQDVSFERDPRRQTRILVSQRPVRVTRGDWLLLGKCSMNITTVTRAFGSERRPDMKEAAMRLDILRLSKRKPRTRAMFVPVGFRLQSVSGSGASSGSSGWGGSSGGPITFGKGRDCDAQVFTASLATEQFSVQLERGACLLTPKPTGISAGTYFLIGRDASGSSVFKDGVYNSENFTLEVVKHTSKPLLLSEGCVFKCGGCEVEVIYTKNATGTGTNSSVTIEEHENLRFLSALPWLNPIVTDLKIIADVARCGQRLKLNLGDLVYEKGDSANFVFIVMSGEVALHIHNANDEHEVRDDSQVLIEQVATGGYFGDVSLDDPLEMTPNCDEQQYEETARASSSCELLVLAREDICGYLGLYMDIIRAHLRHDRNRERIIRRACSCIPWLRNISLQDIRLLSSQAEMAVYPPGSTLFEDGTLFVPALFAGRNTLQLRDGLLVLSRGDARVVRSKGECQVLKLYQEDDATARDLENVDDEAEQYHNEWWSPLDPVLALKSSSVLSVSDVFFRLEAWTTVECYFVAAVHLTHWTVSAEVKQSTTSSVSAISPASQSPLRLNRGNSLRRRRIHHSQVVTSALHSGYSKHMDEDEHKSFDGSEEEDDNASARRWRRKKRNKELLEQTVLEAQNDALIPNALVLYILAGPQRGDIHVVRNVASVGGYLSGADIELNDRYVSRAHAVIEYHEGRYWLYDNGSKWGTFVRLEEENAVDINPGDVFLAGEVEFTCLGSYPERNKPSLCCVM